MTISCNRADNEIDIDLPLCINTNGRTEIVHNFLSYLTVSFEVVKMKANRVLREVVKCACTKREFNSFAGAPHKMSKYFYEFW